MKFWIFWPLWTVAFAVAMPAWVYGELGTIGYGFPYSPVVWLFSALLALGLGVTFAMRLLGEM